jgi:hypothetical protein
MKIVVCIAALAFGLSGQSTPTDDPNYLPRVTPINPGMAPKMKVDPLPAVPSRTFRVNFSKGDELMSGMTEFAEKNNLKMSEVRGLGGISSAVVSVYDPEKGAFKRFNIDQKGRAGFIAGRDHSAKRQTGFSRSRCYRTCRRNRARRASRGIARQSCRKFIRQRVCAGGLVACGLQERALLQLIERLA